MRSMLLSKETSVGMIDPSLLLRPEKVYDDKPVTAFRDYSVDDEDPIKQRVRRTYYTMHTHTTVDFVKGESRLPTVGRGPASATKAVRLQARWRSGSNSTTLSRRSRTH